MDRRARRPNRRERSHGIFELANHVVAPQLHLDRDRKPSNALTNLFGLRMREVQSHVPSALVSIAVLGIKAVTRNKGHVFCQGGAQQRLRVGAFRHAHPEEETSLGMSPGHL